MIKHFFVTLIFFMFLIPEHGLFSDEIKTQNPEVDIKRTSTFSNVNHPQILYWFWTSKTLENKQYLKDLERIARESPFDLVFLTERTGVSFYDFEKMHPIFSEMVKRAHELGIKIGIQFWPKTGDPKPEDSQAIVVEGEFLLNEKGHTTCTMKSRNVRFSKPASPTALFASCPLYSKILRVYAFRKTGDGFYKEETLLDITDKCTVIETPEPDTLSISIDAGEKFAGYTAFVLTAHYHQYGDLFSGYFPRLFENALKTYSDIPFDGTALDEFKYMCIRIQKGSVFRERMYTDSFAQYFRENYGLDLPHTLFDMRFAPEGRPEIRIRAINNYFDALRQGPLRIEREFYKASKKIFGEKTFIGVHNTFHNSLLNDEIWSTGINWWAIPREYGHSDENLPYPYRLGICCSSPMHVMYDMFYHKDPGAFYRKAMEDARYNMRLHYHAWNDDHGWGLDLSNADFLKTISRIEHKIRLLNRFNPPRPRMPCIIVFGYPALANWYPDEKARNPYDINGSLHIREKTMEMWRAGYVCPVVPSYEIDSGNLALDEYGGIIYGGHRFTSMVFLAPQYSKPATLSFMERFIKDSGKLMIDGDATHDFDGKDIRQRFEEIKKRAILDRFSIKDLPSFGIEPNDISGGCRMHDGSVVLTDLESLLESKPKPFRFNIDGNEFSGEYIGVFALLADSYGKIFKLACSGFRQLKRNGKVIFNIENPADIYLERTGSGKYEALIVSDSSDDQNEVNIYEGF